MEETDPEAGTVLAVLGCEGEVGVEIDPEERSIAAEYPSQFVEELLEECLCYRRRLCCAAVERLLLIRRQNYALRRPPAQKDR